MSEATGTLRAKLEITVYEPCPKCKHWAWRSVSTRFPSIKFPRYVPLSTQFCGCPPVISGHSVNERDLETSQLMQLIALNVFGVTSLNPIKDTGGTNRSPSANSAASALTIVAGTSTTTPTVADNALGAPVSGSSGYTTSVTVALVGETGASGSISLTGTITNATGSNINYGEVGITVTVATFVFLLLHDLAQTSAPYYYQVSPNGTLAVNYTLTNG